MFYTVSRDQAPVFLSVQ